MEKLNQLLLNRVAIITGGTRGIGLGIARVLGQAGAKVVLVYRSDNQRANEAMEELKKEGCEAISIQGDVGIKKEAERVVSLVAEKWGKVDILVNNCGILDFTFLENLTEEQFDQVLRANLKSALFCTQAVLPFMKQEKFGRIINASSISGHFADVGQIAYGVSKAGVEMFTKIASAELAPYGITVNAYAPGIIETDMTRSMIEERGHLQKEQIPLNRFGTPDEVGALVLFLSLEEAGYITGEIIGVDGGMLKVQNAWRARYEGKE